MILIALALIGVLTVALAASVIRLIHDIAAEQRQVTRQRELQRTPALSLRD